MIFNMKKIVIFAVFFTSLGICRAGDVGIAATESFVKQYGVGIAKKLQLYRGICGNQNEIAQMLINEARFKDTHFVFYHAYSQGLHIVQEGLRYLYEYVKGIPAPDDFIFLRSWDSEFSGANPYMQLDTVQDFIRSMNGSDVNNINSLQQQALLSVNPFLFGSFENEGSSTFSYFLKNKSARSPNYAQILNRYFSHYGIDIAYTQELLRCADAFQTKTGGIIQIFVPKDLVGKCAYLSLPRGVVWKEPVERHDGSIIAAEEGGLYSRSVLQVMQDDSSSIVNVKHMQFRLFFGRDSILTNPGSGVKMFRFTQLDVDQKKAYEEQVRGMCQKIFDIDAMHKNKERRRLSVRKVQREGVFLSQYMQSAFNIVEALKAHNVRNAIYRGLCRSVQRYVKSGNDINGSNWFGITLLMHACRYGYLDIVKVLVDGGADIYAKSWGFITAMGIARVYGQHEIVAFLCEIIAKDRMQSDKFQSGKEPQGVTGRSVTNSCIKSSL